MSKALVPRLRFPEFRDAGEWESILLHDVAEPVIRERKKPPEPYLGLGVRSHGKGTFLKHHEIPEKNAMEYLYEVQEHDLIVNITFAWEGAIAIAKEDDGHALVSHRFPTYRFNESVTFSEFFQYMILDKRFINELGVISPGGAGRNRVLNKKDFLKLPVLLPKLEEQQKIADCLSSLDALITAESDKLDALKAHKKGLMQRLFPREGESLPELRFPEFRDGGEWGHHSFGEFIVKSFYGTSQSTSEVGQYPVLRMGNMADGGLDYSNLVYIDLERKQFEEIQLQPGDILLNRTNSRELVGKIAMFDLESECITASYIVAYRLEMQRLDPLFCNMMLNTPMYQAKIKLLATPSISQSNINPTTFRNGLEIVIPSLAEQRRIADCLSSLDALIAVQAEKLDTLKAHKKGLIQQLFPGPEAVEA